LTALLYSLELAVAAAGATIVGRSLHRFYPQGCSCVVVLKESHFSIHTYPEHGVYMADFFTCGDGDPTDACIELAEGLGGEYTLRTLPRGCPQ
jgi:S-adenosylmethionine decarboxylase proenzyme